MRHRRSQTQLFVMILLIVVLILFRMMITRAGNSAIEKVKKMDEDKKLQEEVQRRLDAQTEKEKDPLMEELQKRIDSANDPLEELKPKSMPTPQPEVTPTPAPITTPVPAEPPVNSSSR